MLKDFRDQRRPTTGPDSGDVLVVALAERDLPLWFVNEIPPATPLTDVALMVGLASSAEARLRLALIPLLLRHPHLGILAPDVAATLTEPHATTFRFYYTAAVLLQREHRATLTEHLGPQPDIPDHYSPQWEPDSASPQDSLTHLAHHHAQATDLPLNWRGTCDKGATLLLRYLQRTPHRATL